MSGFIITVAWCHLLLVFVDIGNVPLCWRELCRDQLTLLAAEATPATPGRLQPDTVLRNPIYQPQWVCIFTEGKYVE
jgi:hypothetical protein